MYSTAQIVTDFVTDVSKEFFCASAKHGPMNSTHEGLAVIDEELHELRMLVYEGKGAARTPEATKELVQIAAMCLRFYHDVICRK